MARRSTGAPGVAVGLAFTGLAVMTACSAALQTAPTDSSGNVSCSSHRGIPPISATVLLRNFLSHRYSQVHVGQAFAVSLTSADGDLDVPHADNQSTVCQATTTPDGPSRTVTFVATAPGKTGLETTTTHKGRNTPPLYWAGVTVTPAA